MHAQDLRTALERLEAAGDLLRVAAPLSWEYELAAVLWRLRDGPAVRFENVTGYRTPVVGNLLNDRRKLATALGIERTALQARVSRALREPIEPALAAEGPCLAVAYDPAVALTDHFPVPLLSEFDAGRYLSAGVLICRDPESGRRNAAICRLQVTGPGTLGAYLAPTHSRAFLDVHRERGRPMEVAVALGLHPAIVVASQFLTPLDETLVAGGMFREPLLLTRARTVDLEVPAFAEILLEGLIDPREEQPEGPFGEFPGTYAPRRPNPVIRLTAVSSRPDPLFQMIVAGRHPEHLVTGAIAREAGLYEAIRSVVPGVRAVHLTEGGTCRFHAVISIRKRSAGEGKRAIMRAFSEQDLLKHVVVVDEDIDVTDPADVEWAVATRMRAHEDVVIVPGMKSNPVDPMSVDRTISKLGIDATLPLDARAAARHRVDVPAAVAAAIEGRWEEITGAQNQPTGGKR
ncbi:UbiD family decarboxylase [Streptomyces hoynatensis]|uniref:UbiD family decarboxylase n=1 Tax=Streptomyces hoynatensis TaxID=1141874 RepID=A0A3A9YKQ0_9ACTN|nr:UbiD family decarboxylase [Streptomyces hoynatensis]RKN37023.1 UbiD family decarboxylase [Streptomyces hoynatensis]